jgi:hypothetical protein
MATEDGTQVDGTHVCCLCGLEHDAAAGRLHGQRFSCAGCLATEKHMRRALGRIPEQFRSLEAGEKEEFFRTLEQQRRAQSGNLSWETVKGHLTTKLTHQHVEEHSRRVKGKFLPLNVWVAQGWTEDQVRNSPSEHDAEKGCLVYCVSVKELQWGEVFRKTTEELLALEQAAKEKGKSGKGKFGLRAKGADKEEPEETDTAAHNGSCVAAARKHLPALTQAYCSLSAAQQTAEEHPPGSFGEGLLSTLSKQLAVVTKHKLDLEETLRRGTTPGLDERLPEGPEPRELKAVAKTVSACLKEYRSTEAALRAARRAKAKQDRQDAKRAAPQEGAAAPQKRVRAKSKGKKAEQ